MKPRAPIRKPVGLLTADDLVAFPVWEYINDDAGGGGDQDETWVRPVSRLPIDTAENRVIGTHVRLANGECPLALLGNVDLFSREKTTHFLTIGFFGVQGHRFDLARYYDIDASRRSPEGLAAFLNLRLEDVFPIEYDISELVLADAHPARGLIDVQPSAVLTRDQLIALAIG
jgi:hypothetical protein